MTERYKNIDILYEDNHLLVCIKPENLLSQADITGDPDILSELKAYLKRKYRKPGNVYLGLVHRLDRRVGGVMVFARTSKAASRLGEQLRNRTFRKYYLAVVTGIPEKEGQLKDVLIKGNKAKEAELKYRTLGSFTIGKDVFTVLDATPTTGRYNQIRKQFAMIGHPIINDFKYDYPGLKHGDHLGLFAVGISFLHPITNSEMCFSDRRFNCFGAEDWIEYFSEKN